ncbi:hypothetical protein F4804DRAFT_319042 [Jackrogersella minutella]|nr:hypothetical protein F4804DRAFT_319042 [Jackrogersella minutella]
MQWMEAEHRDRSLWNEYEIRLGQRRISEYTVSVPNNAYLCSSINTRRLPQPRMKHRDMIVDNWISAGGDLANLAKIAVSFITNPAAYDCIQEAFAVRGQEFPNEGWVTIDLVSTYDPDLSGVSK